MNLKRGWGMQDLIQYRSVFECEINKKKYVSNNKKVYSLKMRQDYCTNKASKPRNHQILV